MNTIGIILSISIIILLVWNIYEFRYFKKCNTKGSKYFELNEKINFIIAIGSLLIFTAGYLGFNVKHYRQ
jgi:hypothetical protein